MSLVLNHQRPQPHTSKRVLEKAKENGIIAAQEQDTLAMPPMKQVKEDVYPVIMPCYS
jgi:hypothetical protein